MGIWDTFSRTFGFTTGEDEDEQETGTDESEVDEDEEEDEDEESGFDFFSFAADLFKRKEKPSASRGHEQETEEEEEEEPQQPKQQKQKSARSNVIHDPRMSGQAASEQEYTHCERIVTVHQIEECRDIIKCLLRGESVLLNLENIDQKDCGRVVDLLSGAAFALQGRMLKVAHLSYLLAPENVEVISGEPYPNAQARYR